MRLTYICAATIYGCKKYQYYVSRSSMIAQKITARLATSHHNPHMHHHHWHHEKQHLFDGKPVNSQSRVDLTRIKSSVRGSRDHRCQEPFLLQLPLGKIKNNNSNHKHTPMSINPQNPIYCDCDKALPIEMKTGNTNTHRPGPTAGFILHFQTRSRRCSKTNRNGNNLMSTHLRGVGSG